ncbi:hypothetical protein EVAR_13653_1 [Eumeta japonica]|uniref:Uncharacterized protein n=1 Tax=Eumeta variegata TaxID=151549 RepID=A0A4C1UTV7_EUMVA|nr:hypothetical protein EVAR_13653_1 [Eumeta japonica]
MESHLFHCTTPRGQATERRHRFKTGHSDFVTANPYALSKLHRRDGGGWGGDQSARCCRRAEFGAIAN